MVHLGAHGWPLQHDLGDCGITVQIFMWLEVFLFIFLVKWLNVMEEGSDLAGNGTTDHVAIQ